MSSVAFEQAVTAYDALDAALDAAEAIDADALSNAERLVLLERRESWRRRLPAGEHGLLGEVVCAPVAEIGGRLAHVLADRLRIYRGEANRRIDEAHDLRPRRALSGQPLPARLAATAAGQAAGRIGAEQVGIIRDCLAELPCWIDETTRVEVERQLAAVAATHRPDELKKFADCCVERLNPDGDFTDEHRAARRGITIGRQQKDGMSKITGWLDPQLRAGLDALFAKLAAPGACNPADEQPCVDGDPSPEAVTADHRSAAQRHHDALLAMTRSVLCSGDLGHHQGLPVTVVATVELADLQAKAGKARTGGGSWLPTTDLIRMAAHAYHYLLVMDNAKPLELYKGRTTRLATPAQRLVLYATERGCTRPGCDVPAYWCQVHHATEDWGQGGLTNIDDLTLSCGPHNRDVNHGWKTRKRHDGTTEWIQPLTTTTANPAPIRITTPNA